MPWLLTFHIIALLCWCGALLYLPALLVACYSQPAPLSNAAPRPHDTRLPRVAYSGIATPAALTAIILGTLVFVRYRLLDIWLVFKLILVSVLVGLHLLAGWLMIRAEQGQRRHLKRYCYLLVLLMTTTMTAIVWLVLAKPMRDI
jgi:putative membrane protein